MNTESVDVSELPKAKGLAKPGVVLYKGCWFRPQFLQDFLPSLQHFQPQDDDTILASHPKCGTTWLKALLFSVANRHVYTPADTPLLTQNPHVLVPFLGLHISHPDAVHSLQRRLLSVHTPYALLPESVVAGERSSKGRIVYVCRNPLDTVVSFWKFFARGHPDSWPEFTVGDCVDVFCAGESMFGPFWDHVLGFWKASLEKPEKVLFLTYEDMLEDTRSEVKKIAGFLGTPFSAEEESNGVVEEIIELCSFKSLKDLDVNKHGKGNIVPIEFKLFFREGKVGDWVNHLSPSMVERVKSVVEEKLSGSGLAFKYLP